MNAFRFAIFDQAALGPGLEIRQSGQVVGVTNTGLTKSRTVRGNIGVNRRVRAFEMIAWGEDAMEGAVGIVTADADLSLAVGEDQYGFGYDLATGNIRFNGATLATVSPVASGETVSVRLDLELRTITFRLEGVEQYVVDISGSGWDGVTWYIGQSLGSDTLADLQAYLNSGQNTMNFPDPLSSGWYLVQPTIDTIWLGSEDHITDPADVPANQRIEGVIPLRDASFTITRSLSFWPQGGGSVTRPGVAALTILDPLGTYDNLISGDVRDLPVPIYELEEGDTLATADRVGTFVVDRVEAVSDMEKRLMLKDNSARFDNPLQRRIFPPSTGEGAANRIVPISLGSALSVTPVPYNKIPGSGSDTWQYKLHDDSLLGVGYVRDRGDILEGSGPNPVYFISPDFQGIDLLQTPDGKLIADVSSVGGDVPVPPTNLAPGALVGWDDSADVTEGGGQYTFDDTVVTNSGRVESHLRMIALLQPMTTYKYRITINAMSGFFGGTGQRTRVQFIRGIGAGEMPQGALATFESAGTYSGTFTNLSDGAQDFIIALIGTQSGADFAEIDTDIELYEVSNTGVTSDNLVPIKLADFLYEVLEVRGGFASWEWDRASAEAVDDASGAAGVGWHTSEQVPVRRPLEDVLPSYTACLAQDRNGVFRVYRLEAPETLLAQSPSLLMGTITEDDLRSDLRIVPDEAKGLTSSFGLQYNETVLDPSDFVDDFDPVTGVPLDVRIKLSRQHREIVGTAGNFARAYPGAYSAPPLSTRYLRKQDAQNELDRVRGIFETERKFYPARVPLDHPYDLGQLWMLTHSRYSLSDGKPVIVWKIVENRITRTAELTLWG